jgi:hypothetical protein
MKAILTQWQQWRHTVRFLLRCGVRVHELEDMHDDISVWLDRAAAKL